MFRKPVKIKIINTRVRDKFSMKIVLTALTFPHTQAVPLAYSQKSNMRPLHNKAAYFIVYPIVC